MTVTILSEEELERYSRQIILPEIGRAGQRKLRQGKVLVVGAGGLGSPALFYLASAGVGTIGIVDSEDVSLSNLQRQFIHTTKDIGKPKTDSAKKKLKLLNPSVNVVTYFKRLSPRNVDSILKDFDAVVDGSDNFPTRYVVNESCIRLGKALFHGGIFRFGGQVMSIVPGKGPCLRCVFPKTPPTRLVPGCELGGVLNAVAGVVGSIQAGEAIKFLLGTGELLLGKILILDARDMSFKTLSARKRKGCPTCGG
ncbi:MAG: HesA/MoeB/ThiF family protein [Candidatus Eisenbacteria bacterium]|nr:HesA/MoeB/ThiF family protein [Candidatus Eisenbacteria bacterium]